MKKYVAIIMLLFITIAVSAETISPIINKYKNEKGVEVITLDSFMLTMLKPVFKAKGVDVDINALSVVTMGNRSASVNTVNGFKDEVSAILKKNNMQPMVSVNEEGSNVKVYINMKEDYINEMIVLVYEENETTLVNINGKIKMDDVNGNFLSALPMGK